MPSSTPAHGRHSSPSHEGAAAPVLAALDLGTNNCRLLIATPLAHSTRSDGGIRVMDTFSRIVRLGEGLSANHALMPDAMQRTIAALKVCKKKIDHFDIAKSRYVATEACRLASNSREFLHRVEQEVGLTIGVISNEEEARLAFLGCADLLAPSPAHAIIFDIGGGSTEFLWVELRPSGGYKIIDWLSLNQGVMNLSEKFGGNAFAEMYFDDLVGHIITLLRGFDKKNGITGAVAAQQAQMLSTSGTVTTLAAIHLNLDHYIRSRIDGITLPTDTLRDATQAILSMRASERFSHACIGPDRSDYIISGCAIFEAICSLWPVQHVTIADRGVREGIIYDLSHG